MLLRNVLLAVPLLVASACGGDGGAQPRDAAVDAVDASGTPDASCFDLTGLSTPTNEQIINACTPAQKIFKDSHPPLLQPDGSLPPLPP